MKASPAPTPSAFDRWASARLTRHAGSYESSCHASAPRSRVVPSRLPAVRDSAEQSPVLSCPEPLAPATSGWSARSNGDHSRPGCSFRRPAEMNGASDCQSAMKTSQATACITSVWRAARHDRPAACAPHEAARFHSCPGLVLRLPSEFMNRRFPRRAVADSEGGKTISNINSESQELRP